MKRLFGGLIFVLLFGVLGACSDESSSSISSAELTDRENTILSSTADQSFVFDFVHTDDNEVKIWVEKFESGELVEQVGSMSTEDIKEGSIVLATAKAVDEANHHKYHLGIGDDEVIASSSVTFDKASSDLENQSMVLGEMLGEKHLDGEVVLATIAYSDDEFGISSISNDFYEDPNNHMDELNEYQTVYLFKAEFTE